MSVKFDILTLFPEMIEGIVSSSILKRAIEKQNNWDQYYKFS